MTVSSRTPEDDPYTCRVCGAVGLVEPSPLPGDAVCPRCGGYLGRVLDGFGGLLGGASLDTRLDALPAFDSLDLAERVERLGGRPEWDDLARCETVEDVVRYLARLHDGGPDS